MRSIFGTDGVRGVANVDLMTAEMAMNFGRARILAAIKSWHRIVHVWLKRRLCVSPENVSPPPLQYLSYRLFFTLFLMLFTVSPAYGDDPFKPVFESLHHLAPATASAQTTCPICHAAQDQKPSIVVPLWTKTIHPYTLPMERRERPAYTNQPTGSSIDCLACHDGAVGTDMHGIGRGSLQNGTRKFVVGRRETGRLDHPISTTYPRRPDGTLVPKNPTPTFARYWSIPDKNDGGVTLPTGPTSPYFSLPEGPGPDFASSVSLVRTTHGEIQCDSCHTPHNPEIRPFLRTSPQSLCLVCHDR